MRDERAQLLVIEIPAGVEVRVGVLAEAHDDGPANAVGIGAGFAGDGDARKAGVPEVHIAWILQVAPDHFGLVHKAEYTQWAARPPTEIGKLRRCDFFGQLTK